MTDARSPLRALRAAAFAAVCVTLAAVGHALASEAGGGPAHEIRPGALWTAFAVTGAVAWLAGRRRRGVASIGAGLLTVQGLLHLILSGALPYGLSGPPAAHSGMEMADAGTAAAPASRAGSGTGPGMDAVLDGSAGMLLAHLLAAAVCAVWLARGEAALFRLAHAVGALAFAPLRLLLTASALPAAPAPLRPAPGAPAAHRFRGIVLAHTLSRRGPPGRRIPRVTAPGAVAVVTV
ncbi:MULTISPECIES: hypothetical protein [unclassified Streptomyces]|uniref:hypothetical protein n=1 Tax=unclassified Streptomyces TaxID=2593676 RepID=UPI002E2E6BCC|nr:hypothetical protein [Streptomyces sp. NBC_01429]